ncbi:rRNA maturation RNase YbeY [Campylobacter sp. FMV-PI01]|uniref:Endoribonuclease YbeY n=1 Tax=Campylobacter portucalensis TaxID=2608384 RepID=A0A6L5WHV3_9BACT|nr:rRNA maturation RNase YbeY [Campylobacter portucalensis]MSN96022.1 rRNA maturation RNase YbeY [Campylobacter portucalensis]
MIICEEKYPKILDEIIEFLNSGDVELVFVNSVQMYEINKAQRNLDKTTDVLSFPYQKIPNFPIGSIVINLDLAKDMAINFGHNIEDEIALLFIHGILHILGFDHETDSGQMRDMEEKIILNFNLPKSLILRNDDE